MILQVVQLVDVAAAKLDLMDRFKVQYVPETLAVLEEGVAKIVLKENLTNKPVKYRRAIASYAAKGPTLMSIGKSLKTIARNALWESLVLVREQ